MVRIEKVEQLVELAKKHGIINMRCSDEDGVVEFHIGAVPLLEKIAEPKVDPRDARRQQLLTELHSSDLTPEEIERMI